MDREAALFPVHVAMLLMVIGFGVFSFMVIGGTKKVIKITRKAKKRIRRTAAKIRANEALKKSWFYDI